MLLNQGDTIRVDGKEFALGGEVWANDGSPWHGLYGYIMEARIYHTPGNQVVAALTCTFETPPDELAQAIEFRLSEEQGKAVSLKDMPMEEVMLGADCLEPIAHEQTEPREHLYALTYRWTAQGLCENADTLAVARSKDFLLRFMSDHVKTHGKDLIMKNSFFSKETDSAEFWYGVSGGGLAHADTDIRYYINRVPYFCHSEEKKV